MHYSTKVYPSRNAFLYRLRFGPSVIWSLISIEALYTAYQAQGIDAFDISMWVLAIVLTALYLIVRPASRELKLEIDRGHVTIHRQGDVPVSAPIAELSPTVEEVFLGPNWMPWRQRLICLRLDGGPLGPHRYYFEYDGPFAAQTWEAMGIKRFERESTDLNAVTAV